jgi:DNA-binding transcriptional LysR family regulator
MVELDWLETFLAVADRGNFTAASVQVHRSQSRVSAHIALLERSLGATLVDRTHRPARLTAAGQVLAGYAREILAGVGSARSAVAAMRDLDRRRLTVLTTASIGAAFLPSIVVSLLRHHPDLRLELVESGPRDVEDRLRDDGAALGLLPALAPPLPPGLREYRLWRERMRLVVAPDHRFARAGRPVAPAELAGEPLIVTASGAAAEPESLRMLAGRGAHARPAAVVQSPQTLVALAGAGAGTGILNAVAVETCDRDRVAVLDIDDPALAWEVAAYLPDALAAGDVGRTLDAAVRAAAVPPGAERVGAVARCSGADDRGRS